MSPITPIMALFFTIVFLSTLALLGRAFRVILGFVFNRETVLENDGFFESINMDLSFGTVLIPLLCLILTIFGRLLNTYTVFLIVLSSLIISIWFGTRKGIHCEKMSLRFFIEHYEILLLSLVIFFSIFIRIYPALVNSFYVYSGNDAKLYSLIALRVTEEGGYTQSWGSYAADTWNLGVDLHLFMEGYASICSFFHLLTGIDIPKIVLLTSLLYSGLSSLSIFSLSRKLMRNRSIALLSSIFIGLVSRTPMMFAIWGGNAESVGYYLLPTALILIIKVIECEKSHFRTAITSVFIASLALIHYLPIVYLLCFLFPLMIYFFLKKKLVIIVNMIVVFTISLVLISSILVPAFTETLRISGIVYPGRYGWEGFMKWPFLKGIPLFYSSVLEFPNLGNYFWSFSIMILGFAGLILSIRSQAKHSKYLLGWTLMLFLINENGPYGLYHISFPFWNKLLPERFAHVMVFPLCCFSAYFLYETAIFIYRSLIRHRPNRKRLMYFLCFALILMPLFPEISLRFDQIMYHSNKANSVTMNDIDSFNWINNNIPINATFFVITEDAGQWITIFTGRRVFPFRKIMNDPITRNDAEQLSRLMFEEPNNNETLVLLKKYEIEYVFIGNKTSYDAEKLDVTLFKKENFLPIPGVPIGTMIFQIIQ